MNHFIAEILAVLRSHPMIRSVRIITLDETPSGRIELKIRCRLTTPYQLQIWLHREPSALDYAYQLFTHEPVLRWDNAPHYPKISTTPHHFHDPESGVTESPLQGDPLTDLQYVLGAVEAWLRNRDG